MDRSKDSFNSKVPRHRVLIMIVCFYALLYFYSLYGPISSVLGEKVLFCIRWSPIFGIFVFGLYAAVTIITNVIKLKNYPDEAESLLKDVAEAKEGLRKRGYRLDLYYVYS